MKILPLVPLSKFALNIRGTLGKLSLSEITEESYTFGGKATESIAVVADGTPDDKVFFILCHHFNGNKTIGIVKPNGKTGVSVVEEIPQYLKTRNVNKLIIMADQEDIPLNSVFDQTEEKLRIHGIQIISQEENGRCRIYKNRHGSRNFQLIMIINGLDCIPTRKHSIEDHLLKAAISLNIIGDSNCET